MSTPPAPWNAIWDAVVVGAGCGGLAAAWTLARAGQRCLLLGPDGDLAWECGRALAPADGTDGGAWWTVWLAWQRQQGLPAGGAAGELAAHALLADAGGPAWLGYAPLVGVECADGLLASATIATRGGLRRLRARTWLEADGDGPLRRLLGLPAPRPQRWRQHWLLLHPAWPAGRLPEPQLPAGISAAWATTGRNDERLLTLEASDRRILEEGFAGHLAALRAVLPAGAEVAVAGPRCLPIGDAAPPPTDLPANLVLVRCGVMADGLAGRCRAGEQAALALRDAPAATRWRDDAPTAPVPEAELAAAVLVAGTGTAGALAALTAAEQGAATVACDPAWWPGGIGTGGLISSYCAGAAGGRAEMVDAAAAALPFWAGGHGGDARSWHPQAKAVALATALRGAGVRLLAGSTAYRVVQRDGRIEAVDLATPDGLLRVRCRTLVDATGDGDLCALAGATAVSGRRSDGGVLAYTQSAWTVGDDGRLGSTNCDCGWVDAADSAALSRARADGIRLFAGPQRGRVLLFAPALGLRQSRHIATDRTVTLADLVARRRHDDAIGHADSFLDTHASDLHCEDDEAVVWLLACRAFRARLAGDLPYGMLLPRGLDNVWIACRAAGMTPTAAYALRMQRDLQRLGEAAGTAAALAAAGDGGSRHVAIGELQRRLRASSALRPAPVPEPADPLAVLDRGEESAALWPLCAEHPRHAEALRARLDRPDRSGWLAAVLLGAAGDAVAEPRLLAAIVARQTGPEPTQAQRGPFGQRTILPDWALAAVLLRCCGTAACLPALESLTEGAPPFDLRCLVALTAERLLGRLDAAHAGRLRALIHRLAEVPAAAAALPASRSVWRRLQGEADPPLPHVHHHGTVDLSWQLRLIRDRSRG